MNTMCCLSEIAQTYCSKRPQT